MIPLFSDERREVDAPPETGDVGDLKDTLLGPFLYSSFTERAAVGQPNRVLNDADQQRCRYGFRSVNGPCHTG